MIELAFMGWTVFVFGVGLLIGHPWGRETERRESDVRCTRAARIREGL